MGMQHPDAMAMGGMAMGGMNHMAMARRVTRGMGMMGDEGYMGM
jgi:hypothetical protein